MNTATLERPAAPSDPAENVTEILMHRVVWHFRGEDAPTELDEVQTEHIESLMRAGYSQGELIEHDWEGTMTHRGWWQIRNCG